MPVSLAHSQQGGIAYDEDANIVFKNAFNDELFDFSKEITEDTTITAKYSLKDYRITYNLDGGIVSGNPTKYTVEDTIALITPEKVGYTFIGWTGTNLSEKTMSVIIERETMGELTYIANWSANTYQITYVDNVFWVDVTFDYNYEGAKVETIRLSNGEYLEYPTIPTRSNHIFRGWFLNASCTIPYNFNQVIYQDVRLYAGWVEIDGKQVYAFDFQSWSSNTYISWDPRCNQGPHKTYFVAFEGGEHSIFITHSTPTLYANPVFSTC